MNKRHIRHISIIIFFIYILLMIYFLFFAENMGRSDYERQYSYNLIPFKEIERYIKYWDKIGAFTASINLIGNVAAFVPFGALLPVISRSRLKFKESVVLTIDLTILVETIQLITKVGSFDVDDMLLNTIGGIMGYCLFLIIRAVERKVSHVKA